MTKWPVASRPVPHADVPTGQLYYQAVTKGHDDPTFVWGTEVDVSQTRAYLRDLNRTADVMVSLPHVFVRSVAHALKDHPQFNRRVAGRRLYQYEEVNLLMPARDVRGATVILVIERADELSLTQIAESVWDQLSSCNDPARRESSELAQDEARGRRVWRPLLRVMHKLHNRFNLGRGWGFTRLRRGCAYVNDLDFRGAPPMSSYKPSRFPSELQLTSVTRGPVCAKVVAVDGQPEVRPMAPLFIRSDHRLVDAFELGGFVASISNYFAQPSTMDGVENNPVRRAA